MANDVRCMDCEFCITHDVFEGYCEANEERVLIDTTANECSRFKRALKCKFCSQYKAIDSKEFAGECKGNIVYLDLRGCANFKPGIYDFQCNKCRLL